MTCVLLKYQGEGLFEYAGKHLNLLIYRKSIEEMQKTIMEDVLAWNNRKYHDDMTLMVTRRIQ